MDALLLNALLPGRGHEPLLHHGCRLDNTCGRACQDDSLQWVLGENDGLQLQEHGTRAQSHWEY